MLNRIFLMLTERVGELQIEFEEMDGWNAESDAASLLSNLEIPLKFIILNGRYRWKTKGENAFSTISLETQMY